MLCLDYAFIGGARQSAAARPRRQFGAEAGAATHHARHVQRAACASRHLPVTRSRATHAQRGGSIQMLNSQASSATFATGMTVRRVGALKGARPVLSTAFDGAAACRRTVAAFSSGGRQSSARPKPPPCRSHVTTRAYGAALAPPFSQRASGLDRWTFFTNATGYPSGHNSRPASPGHRAATARPASPARRSLASVRPDR